MALPPLELFSLKKRPSRCRAAFSYSGRGSFAARAVLILTEIIGHAISSRTAINSFSRIARCAVYLNQPVALRHRRRQIKLKENKADVAQLVEQPIRNRQVTGSSPVVGSSDCCFLPFRANPSGMNHIRTPLSTEFSLYPLVCAGEASDNRLRRERRYDYEYTNSDPI